jgi:hypothetical protein
MGRGSCRGHVERSVVDELQDVHATRPSGGIQPRHLGAIETAREA